MVVLSEVYTAGTFPLLHSSGTWILQHIFDPPKFSTHPTVILTFSVVLNQSFLRLILAVKVVLSPSKIPKFEQRKPYIGNRQNPPQNR